MHDAAMVALQQLLDAAEKKVIGQRRLDAYLNKGRLSAYLSTRELANKESYESVMKAARAHGAVDLVWDNTPDEQGYIHRVNLRDLDKLADFLGKPTQSSLMQVANQALIAYIAEFPVVSDVLAAWANLKKVRGYGPADADEWVDAMRVIKHMRSRADKERIDQPIREASAGLFKDSKRIEKLTGPLDVLLSGDVLGEVRDAREVWQEIGLFREERPVLLAGNVEVIRTRVTGKLDAPYAGFPPTAVLRLASVPKEVLSIENLTTFHSEAKRRCDEEVLLIYTAGMPSPNWRAMYHRLLNGLRDGTQVRHWGDVDEGGFRIASVLAADAKKCGHVLRPYRMSPLDVPQDKRRPASPAVLDRILRFAKQAGWEDLGLAVHSAAFTTEQESLAEDD